MKKILLLICFCVSSVFAEDKPFIAAKPLITVPGTATADAPGLSDTDTGAIYFDSTLDRFMMSENGGAYGALAVADALLMHLAGTEEATGEKTFSSAITKFGKSGGNSGRFQLVNSGASKGITEWQTIDNTGNTQTTMTTAAQSGARTYIFPDFGASAQFAGTTTAGGVCNFTGPTALRAKALSDAADTISEWGKVNTFSKAIVVTPSVLTDGATPALDASLSNTFTLTAAGNRTIGIPTNAVSGQRIVIAHTASGADRTLALNTGAGGFAFGTDIPALSATTSALTDYIGCIYDSTASKWRVVSYVKGF